MFINYKIADSSAGTYKKAAWLVKEKNGGFSYTSEESEATLFGHFETLSLVSGKTTLTIVKVQWKFPILERFANKHPAIFAFSLASPVILAFIIVLIVNFLQNPN